MLQTGNLSNLMSNASKFTEAREITLRAQQLDDDRRAFEVIDTGMGMSGQTLSTLFTPFKQADASIARWFGGTGWAWRW